MPNDPKTKRILVVDIGGSNVKLMISAEEKRRKFPSGPKLGPSETIEQIKENTRDWEFDTVAVGFPAPIREGKILSDPTHLGKGWEAFDFAKALGKPTRVINDAALQALGSYRGGGRMLFLGLGTGLGSALVWPDHLFPLELGHLPYIDEGIIEEVLGDAGLEELGRKEWQRETLRAIRFLKEALIAEYVVLGGGNAKLLDEKLPDGFELGHNRNVYPGGLRLWETHPETNKPRWRIL